MTEQHRRGAGRCLTANSGKVWGAAAELLPARRAGGWGCSPRMCRGPGSTVYCCTCHCRLLPPICTRQTLWFFSHSAACWHQTPAPAATCRSMLLMSLLALPPRCRMLHTCQPGCCCCMLLLCCEFWAPSAPYCCRQMPHHAVHCTRAATVQQQRQQKHQPAAAAAPACAVLVVVCPSACAPARGRW